MKKALIILAVIAIVAIVAFCPRPYTYNAEKAGSYVTEHAARRSKGLCAQYVRLALEAGGCNTWGHPFTADGYNEFLKSLDFSVVDKNNYRPQTGDVVVFSSVKGHPYGHIAMWNGRQWVSDFRQKGLFVANAYITAQNHKYYRMIKKHPLRHFKMKHHVTALGIDPVVSLGQIIKKFI